MKSILLLLTILTGAISSFAQQGTIAGKVKDKTTNEPIIGATVAITSTSQGATTDFAGNYTISLAPGTYKVSVTYVSYKPQVFENVQVTAGNTTSLNITLEESATALEAVTVTAARQTNTEVALINELKSSNVVVSGMSAEQIVRAQDRDAAEVVKRIPGITIMDNRFIVVRGLSERYNSVMLNDALTPSSEVDVRAFSFDILPTSVIDRVLIYKSPAPELPGDFAGGAIKIYTKNTVNENAASFGFSTSYRGGTTFENFNTYAGSKTDFLGFDNGTRKLPGNFPATSAFQGDLTNAQKAEYGKLLPNIWKFNTATAAPDLRLNFGLNRQFTIGGKKLSSITALSYTSARQHLFITRNNYTRYVPERGKELNWSYQDDLSSQTTRVGLLQNFSLSLNPKNKLEFRNLFNQIGIDEATVREGRQRDYFDEEEKNYFLRYESRSIFTSQLQGSHTSGNDKNIFTWNAGYNYIGRQEPDLRRVRTTRQVSSEGPYEPVIPTASSSAANAGRFYSNLTEKGFIAGGQLEHIFGAPDSTDAEKNLRLKVGFYTERKDRQFDSRYFGYIFPFGSTADRDAITRQPLENTFAPENLDATNGIMLDELTRINDRYSASNTLRAGYLSLAKTLNKFTLYGGVRGEYNYRKLIAEDFSGNANVDDPQFYLLPSINTSYNFNQRSLLRLAYGMTINRPEFREQASFSYYDFIENASIRGNSALKTATVHNLDMRYEFYPSPAELLSVGVFYKKFFNPIETIIQSGSGSTPIYNFANANKATNVGVEAEVRKSLRDISQSTLIQNHSLVLNASYIHSRVDLGTNADVAVQDRERALMGQSPYIINGGLYYQNDEKGWQYALLYNVLGKRIYRVGSADTNPTVYEMPRQVMDVSVTKNFKNGIQLKAGVQDIFNQSFRFIQDTDLNGKITSFDDAIRNYNKGTYTTLGINYNF
ncbi:TonB-dependent receptor [Adhaeribacter rhizoryzae]|uniref:TonB-dependent receptor plug domain-containing protein n=1 Tax=Adhaeribacter rhizoryzae TaxID=2607907 RepID=A0A5M6D8W9_9BACT|nr:TonB-dependent receptor [Adhaeribacter rhizoryzae]KAA5541635.1 TonB-dependent receptor plug domain-containing protein [Adhaeribacter rhizoryzae]